MQDSSTSRPCVFTGKRPVFRLGCCCKVVCRYWSVPLKRDVISSPQDVSSPLMEVSLGRAKVPYNPENATPSKAEAIAVGCDHFKHSNGHVVRSYTLLIRVTCDATGTVNGLEPGECCGVQIF